MRTSIIGTFFLASPVEIQEGQQWYQRAADITAKISGKFGISLAQAAGVIAALSPQNPWERNIRDAYNICEAFTIDGKAAALNVKCGTFNSNKAKAIAILESDGLIHKVAGILNGQKVVAFFYCIIGDPEAVCVDGHAYSIWLGERVSTSDTPKITPKLYERIAQDYRESTHKINSILGSSYLPATVQAITWVVHRNLYQGQRKKRTKKG